MNVQSDIPHVCREELITSLRNPGLQELGFDEKLLPGWGMQGLSCSLGSTGYNFPRWIISKCNTQL